MLRDFCGDSPLINQVGKSIKIAWSSNIQSTFPHQDILHGPKYLVIEICGLKHSETTSCQKVGNYVGIWNLNIECQFTPFTGYIKKYDSWLQQIPLNWLAGFLNHEKARDFNFLSIFGRMWSSGCHCTKCFMRSGLQTKRWLSAQT